MSSSLLKTPILFQAFLVTNGESVTFKVKVGSVLPVWVSVSEAFLGAVQFDGKSSIFYKHQCYDRKSWFCDEMLQPFTTFLYVIYSFSFNQHCYFSPFIFNSKRDNISDITKAEHSSVLSLLLFAAQSQAVI